MDFTPSLIYAWKTIFFLTTPANKKSTFVTTKINNETRKAVHGRYITSSTDFPYLNIGEENAHLG